MFKNCTWKCSLSINEVLMNAFDAFLFSFLGFRVEDTGISGFTQPNTEHHHWVGFAGRLPALCLLCHRRKVSGTEVNIIFCPIRLWVVTVQCVFKVFNGTNPCRRLEILSSSVHTLSNFTLLSTGLELTTGKKSQLYYTVTFEAFQLSWHNVTILFHIEYPDFTHL